MSGFIPRVCAVAMVVALGGCLGTDGPLSSGPVGDVTNAPVGAGINVTAGSKEDFIVNVGRRIFFAKDEATLDDTARETLNNQAAWLNQYTRYRVKVQGYADEPGGPAANKALGLKRAEATKAYLMERGVDGGRIRTTSRGNSEPTMRCADVSCWAQNRHVRTVLE
ncbi:MAG: OmpA family protein [Proteobacteria bacterium]|nr:OmpA family protein [Pseudomonadota bacterium]